MTQTITRVYDNYAHAQGVVASLKVAGIPSDDISLISNSADKADAIKANSAATGAGTGAEIGTAVGGSVGLLVGLGLMAIPGLGPVVAAGWFAATAAGAVAGAVAGGATGGLIGALTGNGLSEEDAHIYAESVRRGGTLVSVRVPDDREMEVTRILAQHPAVNALTRREEYRAGGWERFDPAAPAYLPTKPVITPSPNETRTPMR